MFQTPHSFKPKVVNSKFFNEKVVEQLQSSSKAQDIVIRGEKERHFTEVSHDRDIEEHEMDHHASNVKLIT